MIGDRDSGQYRTPFQFERMIILKIIHGANSSFGMQNKVSRAVNLQK
jgi:hypothetical protein